MNEWGKWERCTRMSCMKKNKIGKFQVDVSAFGMKCQRNMTQWKSGNSKQDKTMDGLL